MFSRKSLPVGTLFMVLVIMLALLGVGYALWSDILYIDGTVDTGTVDAELSFLGDIKENDHGKDVGTCSASLSDENQDGEDELHISVTDGYPSYECWVTFDVHSVGSVPIHIYQPEIKSAPPVEHLTVEIVDCYEDDTQLHFSEEAFCTIYIHVEQGALQDHTYTFSAEVETRQFNEPRPETILVVGNVQDLSSTGWMGWSCPADHPNVVGGGVSKTNTEPFEDPDFPISFVLAEPGATLDGYTYPVFPHFTYPAGETGIAVHNGAIAQTVYPYVYCSE